MTLNDEQAVSAAAADDSRSDAQRAESAADILVDLLRRGPCVVLTGAGVSVASGIPEYRDDEGAWKHSKPMEYRDFVQSLTARRRYWARSLLGFTRITSAKPNAAHTALAQLERKGHVDLLITQNVDGLHSAAGSQQVVDLHGRLDRVVCLGCGLRMPRAELQGELAHLNPQWSASAPVAKPDGDVDLGEVDYAAFRLVDCARCNGILKPDVVFFGESVPARDVQRSMQALEQARGLVIVGSSLMVYSGFRFARAAIRLNIPLLLLNRGRTRADELTSLKLREDAGRVLSEAVTALG